MSSRKLFIVASDRPDLFASLVRAVGHEPGIEILYDRRTVDHAVAGEQVDRRERPEIAAQIRDRGFAVVTTAGIPDARARRRRGI